MVEVVGKKSTAKKQEEKEPPKERTFIVVPVSGIAVVTCADEKAAARAFATEAGFAGKLVVVEADYTEIYAASHRIELKQEQVGNVVADFKSGDESNGDPD